MLDILLFFFFSSRRRHTRFDCDWSSDVCSSDLLQESTHRYRDLSDQELVDMLKMLPRRPLLAGEEDVRLSLAGAQDKVAVKVSGSQISVPLGGSPSTHILKPAHERFGGLVFNEVLCLHL